MDIREFRKSKTKEIIELLRSTRVLRKKISGEVRIMNNSKNEDGIYRVYGPACSVLNLRRERSWLYAKSVLPVGGDRNNYCQGRTSSSIVIYFVYQ